MTELNQNQQSVIKLMKKSDEHARRGFELILKRGDVERFFDALAAEGLFEPDQNPAPIQVETGIRIPYWSALDYLVACAKRASENNDDPLAGKVIGVVRAVSAFREPDGAVRDNSSTFWKFAVILGTLPTSSVAASDVDLVEIWLTSRFGSDQIVHALDEGALRRFLASQAPEDWSKAVQLLRACTVVLWEGAEHRGKGEKEPRLRVDEYSMKELLKHHAAGFGKKVGREASTVLRDRVRDVFSQGGRASWSYVFRPAVENHAQNRVSRGVDNCLVEGFRDSLLAWSDVDVVGAREFVRDLLQNDVEMLRRIGIHVVNERWADLSELYDPANTPDLFSSGHIHELHRLLEAHFEHIGMAGQAATLAAIRAIPPPAGEDAERRLKWIQRRWLSALERTAYQPAAEWIQELNADGIGAPEHPSFNSYIETMWGPGPSAYRVEELIAFAEQGTLKDTLEAFKPSGTWRGESREGVLEALEKAVTASPRVFARALPDFKALDPAYQHALLNGFRQLWDTSGGQASSIDWDAIWNDLVGFIESLLRDAAFGTLIERGEFTQQWVISLIADLIKAGTTDDAHAYPSALLPRTWSVVEGLLDRVKGSDEPDTDPMTHAINTTKGRILEAVFNHALRECRLADKSKGEHSADWARMKPVFDKELAKCESDNLEFSTLAAAYIGNLEYLDSSWVRDNLARIFPLERATNFSSALGGLAYSQPTRRHYVMLRDAGILDRALRLDLKGRDTRKELIERIGLGYLWGEEPLNSPRLEYMFDGDRVEDLEAAAWLFWTVRDEKLSDEQFARIIAFWDKCVTFSAALSQPPAKLMAALGNLAWALPNAAGRNRDLLIAAAPYVGLQHTTHEFLKQLRRLVETNPGEIVDVLAALITTYEPSYDYQDQLKLLVARLAALGQRPAALDFCNKLVHVPGMQQLFKTLTAAE
jgi:hypothetical protein